MDVVVWYTPNQIIDWVARMTQIHANTTLIWMQTQKIYFIKNRRWSDRSTYGWDILNVLRWWPAECMCWCAHEGVCACLPVIVCVCAFGVHFMMVMMIMMMIWEIQKLCYLLSSLCISCVCVRVSSCVHVWVYAYWDYGQRQSTNFLLSRWNR